MIYAVLSLIFAILCVSSLHGMAVKSAIFFLGVTLAFAVSHLISLYEKP